MKYKFYEEDDHYNYQGVPIIDFEIIDEGEYKGTNISHLGSLSGDYIRDIVDKMEQVRDGKLDSYGFGAEDSTIVDVFGQKFANEKYKGKTILSKAFSDFQKEIPFDEIYNLMKDFRDEIDKWEKKTGMKKPGW